MILGVPVISRPDLLRACLESIDADVDLVVIDNSGTGELGDVAAEYGALVVEPASNLGVAASWNHIIRSFPSEPYWLIANADVTFGPGDIDRVCAEMTRARWVGINGDWRLMGLTSEAVERVGFFDENFHPIYCEDADYEYRCDLAGVERYFIDGTTTHVVSATIEDPAYRAKNARTYPENRAYYRAKWGGDLRGGETFTSPFDRGGHVGDWRLDITRLRSLSWA
jgi:GT2 family glycosyltransferase